jgi:Domain of unknown function (DUF4136)
MSENRALALLFAASLTSACAASLTTTVHSDPAADFSRYKTFQIRKSRLQTENEALLDREIAARLEAKGLKPVDHDPDLEVVPRPIRGPQEPEGEVGYGWWTGGASAQATGGVPVGTLVVDLVDPAKNQLVWRGEASGTVPPTGGLKRDKVRIALDRMFADFPPKPAAK